MTYAAWFDLVTDDVIATKPSALRVYGRLLRDHPTIFFQPRDVKVWNLARQLHADRKTIIEALNILIARGYLIEIDRGENNVRRVTMPLIRAVVGQTPPMPSADT